MDDKRSLAGLAHQRNLPHILPPGETVFLTYRLAGSMPGDVLLQLLEGKSAAFRQIEATYSDSAVVNRVKQTEHKRQFVMFDNYLDTSGQGPDWLKLPVIANIIKERIHHRHELDYDLHAYCNMPNHIHLLASIRNEHRPFYEVLKSLKGYSARRANEVLSRVGQPFWQAESYDHLVGDHNEFKRIVAYILNNPLKAGLVDNWEDWPYSYLADNF